MDNNWVVYKHTNKTNNKVYIGISCDYKKRWGSNGIGYYTQAYFYSAIKKYGWDGFNHEIIENNLTKEEACEKEKYYIKLYDSTNNKKGYNISSGGSAPMYGLKHTEESKMKMSKNNSKYWLGKHLPQEMLDKLSKSKKGQIPWNKGKPWSQEMKEKLRNSAIDSQKSKGENNPMFGKFGSNNPNSLRIYCKELQKEFIGIREAARELGLNSPNIQRSLKSNGKYSGGSIDGIGKTHWVYVDKPRNFNGKED